MGEFDLGFGIGGLGAFGEDVEDEAGAVDHDAVVVGPVVVDLAFDVPHLGGREFVVENHVVEFVISDVLLDFLEFT